ncbi:CO040 protein, partial [Balaeniceps rex]|nr:CO040 protein [Balaeniceps rex]
QGKGAGKGPPEPGAAAGPVVTAGDGCVRVAVRAKPGSRCSAVTDVTAEAVGVAIAAPPSEGEANAELCRYLSKVLEVKKSEVILEKGGKSREKVVKILVSMTPDEILEKLKKEASS